MKLNHIFIIAIVLFCCVKAPEPDFFQIKLQKLTEKSILISGSQFNTNQVAIKSKNGIILIDTGFSPAYAAAVRDSLRKQFNTDQYAYVINTHHHWDHVQGNQVFTEATMVGHENCEPAMHRQKPAQPVNTMTTTPQNIQQQPTTKRLPPPPTQSHSG